MDQVLAGPGKSQTPVAADPGDDFSKAVHAEATQIEQLNKPMGILHPTSLESLPARQLESLQAVSKMLEQSRKRKALVWLSPGFPIYEQGGDLVRDVGGGSPVLIETLRSAYQAGIDSLNDARLSVYPFTFTGEGGNGGSSCFGRCEDVGFEHLDMLTGGSVMFAPDPNDFPTLMTNLGKHFDSYYVLTLKAQPTRKTIWIHSSAKLNKLDTKITVGNGFFSTLQ